MSEITDYLSGYLGELDTYMDRLNNNRLSRSDRKLFLEMSNEYYDIFRKSIGDSENNIIVFPDELLKEIEIFIDNIINPADNSKVANQCYDAITQSAGSYIDAVEHTELKFKIFQNDAEILRLQDEKIEMLQRITDIEMKRDGRISPETMAILDVQHSRIINGRVREIKEWEQQSFDSEKPKEAGVIKEQSALEEEKPETAGPPIRLKLPYMTKETFMKVKEEIKSMGAKFNPHEKAWYVEQSIGKDMIDKINKCLAQHDEAIYLNLYHVKPQEFKQTIEQIKQNGARYNPDKKRWYITESDDPHKFWTYLPNHVMLSATDLGTIPEMNSIHAKLNQYKSDAAKKHPDDRMPEHQKETPERV